MAPAFRKSSMKFAVCCVIIMTMTLLMGGVVSSKKQTVRSSAAFSSLLPFPSAAAPVSGRSSETAVKLFAHLERVFRQLPSLWSGWTGGNTAISRQVFDMIDIVTDVAMLTVIGIPILGLVAVGATALSPLLGASAGRKKREASVSPNEGFVNRAGKAILYARNLYDIVSDLEEMFEKYEIKSNDCQLRAICEVHRVGPNSDYADFGDKIIDIVKMEKEVEQYEVIPLAKLFFQMYADAAKYGTSSQTECSVLYPNCEKDIISMIRHRHGHGSSNVSQ